MRTALQNAGPTFKHSGQARLFLDFVAVAANPTAAQAPQEIENALKAQPDFLPALAARAAFAERSSDAKAAIAAYEDILRRYPSFEPATRQLALLRAANGASDKQVIDLLFKARTTYPADAELARALGLVLFRTGDFQRAATFLKECSARYSNDAELFYCLGLAESRLKQRESAQQSLLHALELNPGHPRAAEARQTLNQLK